MESTRDIKQRLSRFAVGTLVSLARTYVLEETAKEFGNVLIVAKPEEIIHAAKAGQSLLRLKDQNWQKRQTRLVRAIKRSHAEEQTIKLLDSMTTVGLLEYLHPYLLELSDEYPQGLQNFSLIINAPSLLKWLDRNLTEVKELLKKEILASS